jgi:hypothetical protein
MSSATSHVTDAPTSSPQVVLCNYSTNYTRSWWWLHT